MGSLGSEIFVERVLKKFASDLFLAPCPQGVGRTLVFLLVCFMYGGVVSSAGWSVPQAQTTSQTSLVHPMGRVLWLSEITKH